jgi:pimeloyl-ACP methyl ester carboxylesterase
VALRSYVDGPFGQIHLRTAGDPTAARPPLICFHMSPMSSRIYERFVDRVGASRFAVAVDTPGFGMSDPPPHPPAIADYARAMRAAIRELGISRPVDVMGYHTGSMIAADLAAGHPKLVRRLVLVSAPIFTDAERAEMRKSYAPVEPALDGSHLLRRWASYVHHNLGRGLDLDDVSDMFPEGLLGRRNGWWGHHAAFAYAADIRLPEIEHPILVLNPGDDLQEESRRASALMQRGQIVELPMWGHGFLDGFTEDALTLVTSFLDAPDSDPFGAIVVPRSATDAPSSRPAGGSSQTLK